MTLKTKSLNSAKQDLRQCILKSAAKLFSSLGLDKTSTRDISKDSQANISMISYHFGGKEGLYKQVIREFALEVQTQSLALYQDKLKTELTRQSFIQEIEVMIRMIIEMRLSHPEITQILDREKIEGMPLSKEVHEEIFYPLIKRFYDIVDEAKVKKIVKPEIHPTIYFLIITESIFGFFQMSKCDLSLKKDSQFFIQDTEKLVQQFLLIFTQGALL